MKNTLKAHLFICTNNKEGKPSCARKGGGELKDKVKEACRTLTGNFRINTSGCLGHCEEGITAVLYPEGKWYTKLDKESSDFLVNEVSQELEKK